MKTDKYYCLKCNQTNACKCGNAENQFIFSYKLRPPKDLKNKMEWRKFIKSCPEFINMVPVRLYSKFKELLEIIKYPDSKINGREWKSWNEKNVNEFMKEKRFEIKEMLTRAGFELSDEEFEKLLNNVNYNSNKVEFELFKSQGDWFINNYKYTINDKNINFIEALKKEGLESKDTYYEDVIDKYINGECELLVSYLYQINDKDGEVFEIAQDLDDGRPYHYVYKINNKFYDINGRHHDVYSIMEKIYYFDEHSEYDFKKIEKIEIMKLPKINYKNKLTKKLDKEKEIDINFN